MTSVRPRICSTAATHGRRRLGCWVADEAAGTSTPGAGTVKLLGADRREDATGRSGDDTRSYAAMATPVTSAQVVKAWLRAMRNLAAVSWLGQAGEEVGDLIRGGKEPLHLPRRLETFHDPLSSPRWLVGILRPVVEAFVLAVLDAGHDLPLGGGVAPQFVGDQHTRRSPLLLQQLAQ